MIKNKLKRILIMTTLCLGVVSSSCFASPLGELQDKIGTDKIAHFGAGYFINSELKRHTKMTDFERQLTVFGLSVIKEYADNKFDKNDIIATMLGSIGCSLSGKF